MIHANIQTEFQKLHNVLTRFKADLPSNDLLELDTFFKVYENNIQSAIESGRNLRIAIVGQMKAGKSSFLNALLFPVDVLPKAATPMTAALTKIAYAPKPYVEIEFYSHADWQQIEENAQEYTRQYLEKESELLQQAQASQTTSLFGGMSRFGRNNAPETQLKTINSASIQQEISHELRSCYELVEIAKAINVHEFLGKTQKIEADNLAKLALQMTNYVGSTGKYTAITKMLSLFADDERLKDIEIYDTPGFNDPVVSRGTQTRKFLGQCDVVFLLSSVNQFLTKSDLALLREQLTSAGIDSKAVHIIATQRDIAISMDRDLITKAKLLALQKPEAERDKVTVGAMVYLLQQKIENMAHQTLQLHLTGDSVDDTTRNLLTHLLEKKPATVSAISWRMAEQLPNLGSDLVENYHRLVQDSGYQFNEADLRSFSNIVPLRDMMGEQKHQKHELLARKLDNLSQGANTYLFNLKQKTLANIDERLAQLDNSNIDQLKRREELLTKKLRSGKQSISDTLREESDIILAKVEDFISELYRLRDQFSNIETLESRSYRTETYEQSGFWGGLFSFFGSPIYRTREVEVVTTYAQVQDSIEQIEAFAEESLSQLQNGLTTIVNMQQLRKNVLKSAIDLFDTEDADFDLASFKSQVNQCLEAFKPPKLQYSADAFTKNIIRQFGSGKVDENQITRLKTAHRNALRDVVEEVAKVGRSAKIDIENYFDLMQNNLLENVINVIEKDVELLKAQLNNKESAKQSLGEFKQALATL